MLNLNPSFIGRKYYTHDPKTTYIICGVYVKPDSGVIVIGEFHPSNTSNETKIVTHKITDLNLLP